jgi:hypothetical protein
LPTGRALSQDPVGHLHLGKQGGQQAKEIQASQADQGARVTDDDTHGLGAG